MRLLASILAVSLGSGTFAQEAPSPPSSQIRVVPGGVAGTSETITVPVGTKIPVKLTNTISTSAAKAGDGLRVVTAFPVTVGTQLAIPAGTYIEGRIDKISKKKSANQDVLRMHFTQLVFSNGYQVNLEGATAVTQVWEDYEDKQEAIAPPQAHVPGALTFQQSPNPPSLPQPPHHGVPPALIGVAVGSTALVIVAVLVGRHHGHDVVFDVGSPFDLLLEKPLTLEASRIPTAPPGY